MNKWKQRAREWRKEANSYKGYYIDTDLTLKRERIQNDLLTERVNKELARVQGVCEVTQAQVLKHAATIADLRERDRVSGQNFRALMSEKGALLAWQRRVREAWDAYDAEDEVEASTLDRLPRAIEVEAGTKEEP